MQTVTKHAEFGNTSMFQNFFLLLNLLAELAANYISGIPATLAIGALSAADVLVSTAVDYVRDGQKRVQKAAAEIDIAAGCSMASTTAIREVVALVVITSADAFATIAGDIATGGDLAIVPDLPAGYVQLGYVRIRAAANTAFVANTTLLNAAGITTTFVTEPVPMQNLTKLAKIGYQ